MKPHQSQDFACVKNTQDTPSKEYLGTACVVSIPVRAELGTEEHLNLQPFVFPNANEWELCSD